MTLPWMQGLPKSIVEFHAVVATDLVCEDCLLACRWPNGFAWLEVRPTRGAAAETSWRPASVAPGILPCGRQTTAVAVSITSMLITIAISLFR